MEFGELYRFGKKLAHAGELRACLYAPYATLTASGGGNSGGLVGSFAFVAKTVTMTGQMSFHYNEALRNVQTVGSKRRGESSREEMRLGSDTSGLSALTANFLP